MVTIRSRIVVFALLWVLPACFASQDRSANASVRIVSDSGVVAPEIFQLLVLTDVTTDGTLADIVAQTQKQWLRAPGSERWDIAGTASAADQEIYACLHKLAICQEVYPSGKHYEHVMILGALFDTMVQRMQYAIYLWNQGVRFNNIALLAGARPVVPAQGENQEALEKFCGHAIEHMAQTEADLINFVYENIDMPADMRAVPVQIIDVPMLQKADGTMRRPNTADTIEYWLNIKPQPGVVLAVSNQPYVEYQDAVLRTLLPIEYPVQTVGSKCVEDKKIGILLDTLARVLYQENVRLKKSA